MMTDGSRRRSKGYDHDPLTKAGWPSSRARASHATDVHRVGTGRGAHDAEIILPPFEDRPNCNAPMGRERSLVFAQDNQRQFMQGVSFGLSAAARDRDLGYSVLLAENDAARSLAQINSLQDRAVGGVVVAPVDSEAISPSLRRLIHSGVYVGTIVPSPAITILNAPQYLTGRLLGEAAASHIRERLAGRANVVILTHDSLEFVAPRFVAMRDALRAVPGATIVADISPVTVDHEGGYDMMKTILVAKPHIDVVLGADTVVLGALAAMRAQASASGSVLRRDRRRARGGGGAESPKPLQDQRQPFARIFGYALGHLAADFLEGGTSRRPWTSSSGAYPRDAGPIRGRWT